MDNETLRVLRERRSIRKYKKEQIKDEELDAILEAGTWAASGKNLQTAVMVVVQDQETIQLMSRLNAQIFGRPGTDPFYGAPRTSGRGWQRSSPGTWAGPSTRTGRSWPPAAPQRP